MKPLFLFSSFHGVIKAPFDISKAHGPTDWPAVIIPSNETINDLAKKKKVLLSGLKTQWCQIHNENCARMCDFVCVNGPSIIVCFAWMTLL